MKGECKWLAEPPPMSFTQVADKRTSLVYACPRNQAKTKKEIS